MYIYIYVNHVYIYICIYLYLQMRFCSITFPQELGKRRTLRQVSRDPKSGSLPRVSQGTLHQVFGFGVRV